MEIALSAEILGCGWFGERKNSQMLAVIALFLAVMKCKVMRGITYPSKPKAQFRFVGHTI
jgi:hypothetical protein